MTSPGPRDEVPFEVGPRELKRRLDDDEAVLLLDVRQPWEFAYCRIDGAVLLPLPELQDRWTELDRQAEIVVYCKVGERSAWAVDFLRRHGFPRAQNLRGGIYGWAREVDPGVLPG